MKNNYKETTHTQRGHTIYRPILEQGDILRYLPSKNEAPLMNDNLTGDYWTSTFIAKPRTSAFKYTVGGTVSEEDRGKVLHVRAVHVRP